MYLVATEVQCYYRDVAQFGRALRSGRRGRRFKSCHPDHRATLVADIFRGVAQLVAHTSGGRGAAGSSPVTPTISSVHNVYEVMNTRFFIFMPFLLFLSIQLQHLFLC